MVIELASVTDLADGSRGRIVVVGSHGGALTGRLAAQAGVAALVCHDAGVGLNQAGIAALEILDALRVPAVSVDFRTARIGDPGDLIARGVLSFVNRSARRRGLASGQSVRDGIDHLRAAPVHDVSAMVPAHVTIEAETMVVAGRDVFLVDTASELTLEHQGAIVITGSHGGLPGNAASRAARTEPHFLAFNDAGVGIDESGIARLPVLQSRGIAAVCVSTSSAEIGNARSTYGAGRISFANDYARGMGATPGKRLKDAVVELAVSTQQCTLSSGNSVR